MRESMKSNPPAVAPGSNPLVLVVDDEAGMRDVITTWLTMENIPCVAAGTVDEAKTLLRNQPIAVTLLDWSLDRSGATNSS